MNYVTDIKILISDDNAIIRKLLRKTLLLISADFVIEEAADGSECLDRLESFKPDLLLLDLMMPKLNGLKVLQKMAKDHLFSSTTVVVVSGLEDAESAALINCMKIGASDFIYKPFRGKLIVYKIIAQIRNIIIRHNLTEQVAGNELLRSELKLDPVSFDFNVDMSDFLKTPVQESESKNITDDEGGEPVGDDKGVAQKDSDEKESGDDEEEPKVVPEEEASD